MAGGYARLFRQDRPCVHHARSWLHQRNDLAGFSAPASIAGLDVAGHASLRDPYNPQGMLDQHAMAKLTTAATGRLIMQSALSSSCLAMPTFGMVEEKIILTSRGAMAAAYSIVVRTPALSVYVAVDEPDRT